MVSITSSKSSSIQHDVPFVNYGPVYLKIDNKAAHASERGYLQSDRSLPQRAVMFRSALPSFTNMVTSVSKTTKWRWPKSNFKASKWQSTNQWVTSRMLRPLFIQSMTGTNESNAVQRSKNVLQIETIQQTQNCGKMHRTKQD